MVMAILVIGGYQWLSMVISDTDKSFLSQLLMVIDGYLWLLMQCISTVQLLSWLLVVISGY